jgi:hypothetical protein
MSRPGKLFERKNQYLPRKLVCRATTGFIGLILIISCATTSNSFGKDDFQQPTTATKPLILQLIIKFRTDTPPPSAADFTDQLSIDAGARLIYLHPISGGAHVFGVKNISDPLQVEEIIRRLTKRSDILYVEQDRILQPLQR